MFGIGAFFAKPLVKYGAIALLVIGLVVGVVLYLDSVRREGRKAGAAEVTGAVQGATIKKTEDTRVHKEAIDAETDKLPMEDILKRTR